MVAAVLPAASLLLALVTYAFQLAVLTMALAVVARVADRTVTGWAAGALAAVTVVWTGCHLVLALRRRIPVYDATVGDLTVGDGVASTPDAPAGRRPERPRAGAR
jgi:ATP synthase protein I